MKKLLSSFVIGALCVCSATAFCEEQKSVSVNVDSRAVDFSDQAPVIEKDYVLIPLRGALEAMDAKVAWNGDTQEVTVDAYNFRTRVMLNIGSTAVRKFDYKSVTEAVRTDIESPVAPVIMNGRTMVPLRVISESLGADVQWDPDTYTVNITSKQCAAKFDTENFESTLPVISLSSDAADVKSGDSVTVKVDLSNADAVKDYNYAGGSITVYYDSSLYTYKGYTLMSGGTAVEPFAASDNGSFKEDSVKIAYLFNPDTTAAFTDGTIAELKFTALSDNAGEFKLSDRITNLGYDCSLTASKDSNAYTFERAYELKLDTSAIVPGKAGDENTEAADEETAAEDIVAEGSADAAESADTTADADTADVESSSDNAADADAAAEK